MTGVEFKSDSVKAKFVTSKGQGGFKLVLIMSRTSMQIKRNPALIEKTPLQFSLLIQI